MKPLRLAVTLGDPSGIGPEVTVKALELFLGSPGTGFVVVGDLPAMKAAVSRFAGPSLRKAWAGCPRSDDPAKTASAPLAFLTASHLPFGRIKPGAPGADEGRAAAGALAAGFALWERGVCQALVTAPVSKAALLAGGFSHPGHTSWLSLKTGSRGVMMLAAGRFRVVPLTVHLPLAEVPSALSLPLLLETLRIVHHDLQRKFGIQKPRLAVAGLNPHAGEEGKLGREEEEIISPALAAAVEEGIMVSGPYPADTLFAPGRRGEYDAAVCMYHDQALIPLKTLAFARAVNVTLGLPLIRTSPAHGTAPDIAWKGRADPSSMTAALRLALRLARRERRLSSPQH